MVRVQIEGLEALAKFINLTEQKKTKVNGLVRKHGTSLANKTRDNMRDSYIHGYSTGRTSNSTQVTFTNGGLTAIVEPHTDYFDYLELGTRKMEAMPTLHPAFFDESELFKQDIIDLFKNN